LVNHLGLELQVKAGLTTREINIIANTKKEPLINDYFCIFKLQ